jgi:hypothetical protein
MIERRLETLIGIYLWVALVEGTLLFVFSWLAPDFWLRCGLATSSRPC